MTAPDTAALVERHLTGAEIREVVERLRRAVPQVYDCIDGANTIEALQRQLAEIKEAIRIKGGTEHAPTEDAYILACRAIDKHRARADLLATQVERLERLLELAIGRLRWCANANPGPSTPEGRENVRGWARDLRVRANTALASAQEQPATPARRAALSPGGADAG